MARFLGFCSRTCIGDQRLSILFEVICGTHVLVTKPIYQNKQKGNDSEGNHEITVSGCSEG